MEEGQIQLANSYLLEQNKYLRKKFNYFRRDQALIRQRLATILKGDQARNQEIEGLRRENEDLKQRVAQQRLLIETQQEQISRLSNFQDDLSNRSVNSTCNSVQFSGRRSKPFFTTIQQDKFFSPTSMKAIMNESVTESTPKKAIRKLSMRAALQAQFVLTHPDLNPIDEQLEEMGRRIS